MVLIARCTVDYSDYRWFRSGVITRTWKASEYFRMVTVITRLQEKREGHMRACGNYDALTNLSHGSHIKTGGVSNTCNRVTGMAWGILDVVTNGWLLITATVGGCNQSCNQCNQEKPHMLGGGVGTYKTTDNNFRSQGVIIHIIGSYLKGVERSVWTDDNGVGVAPLSAFNADGCPPTLPKSEILDRSETLRAARGHHAVS